MKPIASTTRAFTLIELLVVVAIIIALLAILLPSMNRAVLVSNAAVCASNVRQLHTAYVNLLSDRFMAGPDFNGPDGLGEWMLPLVDYHDGVDDLRFCPLATEVNPADATAWGHVGSATSAWSRPHASGQTIYGSYGFNGFLYGSIAAGYANAYSSAPHPGSWMYKLSDIPTPSTTPLMADSNWLDLFPHHDNLVPPSTTTGWQWHTAPNAGNGLYMLGRVVLDRHLRRTNVAFVDGHVEGVELENLWDLQWSRTFERQGAVSIPQ